MTFVSFIVNETVVPIATEWSTNVALKAFGQKHIPEGKQNFTFKEVKEGGTLKDYSMLEIVQTALCIILLFWMLLKKAPSKFYRLEKV